MSWASSLCALYDANAWRAGETEQWNGKKLTLLPIGYDTRKAQIEIIIDIKGNFVDACTLEKDEAETIVPYPEGKTNGIKALPLCENLSYVAGDFLDKVTLYYDGKITEEKRQKEFDKIKKSFLTYQAGLQAWCSSPYAHPKVEAVYRYILKKNVISNLLQCGVLSTDKDGKLSDKKKIQGARIEKAFVRYRVYTDNIASPESLYASDECFSSAIWLDKSVQKSFIEYFLSTIKEFDLCYLTGERTLPAKTNPAKLRGERDTKAKLISADDDENFTYRGRFNTKDKYTKYNEAMSIGYEASQKIHNALKWIIRRQGYSRDGLCIVAWESALKDIPAFYSSSAEILGVINEDEPDAEITDDALFDEDETAVPVTNYVAAIEFNAAIDGYAIRLSDTSNMVVMALEGATPGRLAMTYYKELSTSRYLENIRRWHESCCWRQEYFNKDKKFFQYEGIASISEIAHAVYGTEQNKRLVLKASDDGNKPMLVSAFERLRPCIIENKRIPYDFVVSAVRKASNPLAYQKNSNYLRVLHIACSLLKRNYWEKGVMFNMELDTKCTDRSYLYGRLLAVAEKVERSTYEKGETRTTNAERYMPQFSRTPFRTWGIIRKSTHFYLSQLKPGSREYYKNLYGEISGLFKDGDFESKSALDGKYLLGYDCQRTALKHNNHDNKLENDTITSETEGM